MKTFSLLIVLLPCLLRAQESSRLSLRQVVALARGQSIAARQAATTKETRAWEFRTFQSNYKPQLLLTSRLPAFSRSFQEVVQPDGTIQFQPVRNNNSSVGLSLEQNLSKTGGTIFAATQLQRFDDFARHNTLYNGTLFALGLVQPLFRFNALQWDKKIEPLKYDESRQAFLEDMESISLTVSNLYFDLLLAQVNLAIADTNLVNTGRILRIAGEKYELGKTSRNEILQLRLEQLKAQKAVATARRDVEIAGLNLRSFTGLSDAERLDLILPMPDNLPAISTEQLLQEAFDNRADAIAFGRRLLEADRGVAKAKGETGLNANLVANLGFSNSGPKLGDLSRTPQNYQTIEIQFDVPILDWGRARARTKTAEASRDLAKQSVEQDRETFRQQIITEATLFDMLKSQLSLTAQADSIASEKYQIAQDRYVLGDLGITDLSIAFAEKDQAKRDFIGALRDYWAAYFRLRLLTLFDFEKQEKIR